MMELANEDLQTAIVSILKDIKENMSIIERNRIYTFTYIHI